MVRVIKTICLSIILVLLTGMLACRKDKPTPCSNNSECFEFDWGNQSPAITWFSNERFQYKSPYFNPNNGDEFVYNYYDFELNKFSLMKYNLVTSEKATLASDVKIISQPKWSREGWIAFDNVFNKNYQIWVIKDNGDSLKQFTNTKYNLYPAWGDGEYLYLQHTPILASNSFFLKQNINNPKHDTIMKHGDINEGVSILNDISNNMLISQTLINNTPSIGYTNLNLISFNNLINLEQSNLIGLLGLCWSNNSSVAYFTVFNNSENDGLFRLNVITSEYTRLFPFCDSKRYTKISTSPDGTKLIGERVDSYLDKDTDNNPTGQVIENSSIYIIDLQTLKETKINLE